jgi:hypothetical protein
MPAAESLKEELALAQRFEDQYQAAAAQSAAGASALSDSGG